MSSNLKKYLALSKRNFGNPIKTKSPTIIIESDDWGNVRMPSIEAFNQMVHKYPKMLNCPYLRNDSIATTEDLNIIYDTLKAIHQKTGKKVVITANAVVTNPDFKKIEADNFERYYFEKIDETINRYNKAGGFETWKQIMSSEFFKLQYHGREHVHPGRWINDLKANNEEALYAFNNQIFGISTSISSTKRKSYLEAYAIDDPTELNDRLISFVQGSEIFFELFGFKSKSFIAPNYIWNNEIEEICQNIGISILQGSNLGNRNTKDSNAVNLIRSYRNVFFEPFSNYKKDLIKDTLREIEFAFFFKRPAIICMHRVNLIGRISKVNRDYNLGLLQKLLLKVIEKYPNVEFKSSDQLVEK